MTRRAITTLRPGDYVWLARTYPKPTIYHQPRRHDEPDVEHTTRGRTAVLPAWAFTICGQLTSAAIWEPGWSESWPAPRFAVGDSHGHYLPLWLLNPENVRACRQCFDGVRAPQHRVTEHG